MIDHHNEGRREALRLLLEHYSEEQRQEQYRWSPRLQSRSVLGARTALVRMRGKNAEWHRRLMWHIHHRRLRDLPATTQRRVDEALDWLAAQLPFPIVAPQSILDDLRDLRDYRGLPTGLHPETVRLADQILELADEEDERLDPDDEDVSYFDGRRAVSLSSDAPRAGGRFASLGVDSIADVFMENGPSGAYQGSQEGQRWRTRERRRRPRPITAPSKAAELLVLLSGRSLEEIRACLRRGRPTAEQRATRRDASRAIWQLRSTDKVAAHALSRALGCDAATIWRLATAGHAENARSQKTEGEGKSSTTAA